MKLGWYFSQRYTFDTYNSTASKAMLQGYRQNKILQKLKMRFLGPLFLKIFQPTEVILRNGKKI